MQRKPVRLIETLKRLNAAELKALQVSTRGFMQEHKGGGSRFFNNFKSEQLIDAEYFADWLADIQKLYREAKVDPAWVEELCKKHHDDLKMIAKDVFSEEDQAFIIQLLNKIVNAACEKFLDKSGSFDPAVVEILDLRDVMGQCDEQSFLKLILTSFIQRIRAEIERKQSEEMSDEDHLKIAPVYGAFSKFYKDYYCEIYLPEYIKKEIIGKRQEQLAEEKSERETRDQNTKVLSDFMREVSDFKLEGNEQDIYDLIAAGSMSSHETVDGTLAAMRNGLDKCVHVGLEEGQLAAALRKRLPDYRPGTPISPLSRSSSSVSSMGSDSSFADLELPPSADAQSVEGASKVSLAPFLRTKAEVYSPASARDVLSPLSAPARSLAAPWGFSLRPPSIFRQQSAPLTPTPNVSSFFSRLSGAKISVSLSGSPVAAAEEKEKKGTKEVLLEHLDRAKMKLQLVLNRKKKADAEPNPLDDQEKRKMLGIGF